jgi:phosphoribosylaminoimidazolecarboxamide formyltransferase/IMP cyclohydrolase
VTAKRALLSVYDKTGLIEFARGLNHLGFELIASGGTARTLSEAGLPVTPVETVTGYPELLGGRVKTLHPAIHAGILARRTPDHLNELQARRLAPIDLVAVNLYPFRETVFRKDVTLEEALEQIDIGGVALLRAAAKNFPSVLVLCDPGDYTHVLQALRQNGIDIEMRRRLALKAFQHTSSYDAAVATYLTGPRQGFPEMWVLGVHKVQDLRYGENPHQQAAFYRLEGQPSGFEQLQGKELSYNNLLDLDAAWGLVQEFAEPTVAIIKHTNPCGCASADSLSEAYCLALAADPVSAFGSIIAVNRPLDVTTAEAMTNLFIEVLVAPDYSSEALVCLASKRNCRVVRAQPVTPLTFALRSLRDGFLVQTPDEQMEPPIAWKVVTDRRPTEQELIVLSFAWKVCKHVKSNAIVLARSEGKALGIVGVGAGQMSRLDSVHIATKKAGERARGSVLASDAFFPFSDGVEAAAQAGVTSIVQPGGSVRDEEIIATANRLGLAMCFTGTRHFRH